MLGTGDAAVYADRADWDYSTVVAVHNLAAREAPARLELGGEAGCWICSKTRSTRSRAAPATVERRHYEGRWYRLRRPGQRLPS